MPCGVDGHGSERFVRSGVCVLCQKARTELWRKLNRAHMKAYAAAYGEKNREVLREKQAAYRATNIVARREQVQRWKKENPHRNTALEMKRYAAKLRRTPAWLTKAHWAEIEGIYHFSKVMEQITGKKYHVDHIVPLQSDVVSGLHVPWNLRAIPATENQSKSNHLIGA